MDNEWKQNTDKRSNGEPNFFSEYEQEAEEESKKPVLIRILALFTFLAFAGFIFLTIWPGLTLPSLDFLSQSDKLSKNPSIDRLKQYVVQVNVISRPGKAIVAQKSGTGFNISPKGIIVTNRHVLSDAVNITVTFTDGKILPAKSYRESPDMDLALIYLETQELPAAAMNMKRMGKVGDKVVIIGNPLGISNVVMKGTISAYLKVSGFSAPVLLIDAPVHPGNSGSPVFDENRQVIGVVFGTVQGTDDSKQQGAVIPVGEILNFLRKDPLLSF